MKFALGFALGAWAGLALYGRIPHYVGLLLADEPETPIDWMPKSYYFNGGVRSDNH